MINFKDYYNIANISEIPIIDDVWDWESCIYNQDDIFKSNIYKNQPFTQFMINNLKIKQIMEDNFLKVNAHEVIKSILPYLKAYAKNNWNENILEQYKNVTEDDWIYGWLQEFHTLNVQGYEEIEKEIMKYINNKTVLQEGNFKLILNLEQIIEIGSIKEAQNLHNKYRDDGNFRSSNLFDSLILDETNTEVGYLSYNGRFWNWDNKDNPFLNGSTHKHLYNALKNKLYSKNSLSL
ncbi:hypothetical protein KHQ81_15690 (plasmid) [Mycoplasmatota bacterium]|nr:hypothetical protein KHQ81_15690 [Mycoplasmatota bacterium]